MPNNILYQYGLNPSDYHIESFGSGLINHTFKLSGKIDEFILQQINVDVFKSPHSIANNLIALQTYLKKMHPDYFFVGMLPSTSGDFLIKSASGEYYRLFPFVKGSKSLDFINNDKEAFEAAKQFGKFTFLLNDFDINLLEYTLPDFHNLKLRFEQFKTACSNAVTERIDRAHNEIKEVYNHKNILQTYIQLTANNEIPLRVIHHDTKISNVLFDDKHRGICVIDMDTVMPGYFLSDVGDMMRTYLSPANEEETDLSKVYVRETVFSAICRGYLSEMRSILTKEEKENFVFSGEFMIYMQAIRFLTDYLNKDVYYGAKYPDHNLNRAKNQFKLLNEYVLAKDKFRQLVIETDEITMASPN